MRIRLFLSFVVLILCLTLAGVALTKAQDALPGQIDSTGTQRVTLKDGRMLTGSTEIVGNQIKLTTEDGREFTFTRDEIASIRDVATPKEDYLRRQMQIDAADPQALYELAEWAWATHPDNDDVLKLAQDDLRRAMEKKEDFKLAELLQKQIAGKLKLLRAGGGDVIRTGPARGLRDEDLLSDRDKFWVRLMEMNPEQRGLKIVYKDSVLQRYIDAMRGRQLDNWDRPGKKDHFLAQPRNMQVAEILRNMPENWDLLKDIHVERDPWFMLRFRSQIWPLIKSSCAQANCHGGPAPRGDLRLFPVPGRSDRVDYTNYVILSGWQKNGRWLIDRNNPEESLLLQFGLNPRIAKNRHPGTGDDTKEFPVLFTNQQSSGYRRVLGWIHSLKGPMHPDYHLNWKPPHDMPVDTSGRAAIPD
jgi:hypothetical protein